MAHDGTHNSTVESTRYRLRSLHNAVYRNSITKRLIMQSNTHCGCPCPSCNGTGWIADPWPESETGWGCTLCGGTGDVQPNPGPSLLTPPTPGKRRVRDCGQGRKSENLFWKNSASFLKIRLAGEIFRVRVYTECRMKRLLLVGLLVAAALLAQVVRCAVDGQNCVFTGKTQIVSGVLMKEYRCPMGHVNWAR